MSERVEYKMVGANLVTKTVYGKTIAYAAYEPTSDEFPHAAVIDYNGNKYGRIMSRKPITNGLLSVDAQRMVAEDVSYTDILAAYPEAKKGQKSGGYVDLYT